MKNTTTVRRTIVIDNELVSKLEKLKAKRPPGIETLSFSEVVRIGLREWIRRGAEMPFQVEHE